MEVVTGKWCYSFDQERYQGSFDTAAEAAAAAFAEEQDAVTCHVGECVDPNNEMSALCIGQQLNESLADMLYEIVGEANECFDLTTDQELSLGAAVLKWVADNGGFKCWGVKNPRMMHRDTIVQHSADAVQWLCECGQRCDSFSSEWRWNGAEWEHHDGYPIGHVPATLTPITG